ncbi:uncharacterized protein L969DRAFT_17234 [Mixia osmundae IAM 14324]|uniref:Succinate dehydrogenase assembly factor 4, mitochondrial n=1 Tax=Mixia osmundae (strain CBS 9802 / IAM 14324 / JCM 22182 / KY 12970) TaxID=764103 RepID=G7E3B3_MIXOS|nr:uncharacterized protein L969DRAFT_17234 [Mixia osmundae IAM 14324]KEI39310.1 hypothetical protein L969DRAFT_17234 [Mixia osmundae IAM 14324]GAA97323.1 hypothetical protein E5Q_04001 [Mixia osmundae IAM 14324]
MSFRLITCTCRAALPRTLSTARPSRSTFATTTSRWQEDDAAAKLEILKARAAKAKRNATLIDRPSPPSLPAAEQREFEELQKQAYAPFSSDAANAANIESQGIVDETEVHHPDLRKKPKPLFEGEVNPQTGEVGGPKREPFLQNARDWSYGGRVTDL